MANRDLYQEVTDTIVEALEAGTVPWVKPWIPGPHGGAHRNGLSGHVYSGINIFLLEIAAASRGYTSPEWFTFKQAKKAGGHVRKGEGSTTVVFWKMLRAKEEDEETGEEETRVIPLLRHYNVFNRDQIEGLPEIEEEEEAPAREERTFPLAEQVAAASRVPIQNDPARACYSPVLDEIRIPDAARFEDDGAFWATLMHELVHATGHPSRLDRDMTGRFGSEAYAAEELVAELGSAYLSRVTELDGTLQHPEYIANWIQVLKSDKRAIFTASSAAKKASDFLLGQAGLDRNGEPLEKEAAAA